MLSAIHEIISEFPDVCKYMGTEEPSPVDPTTASSCIYVLVHQSLLLENIFEIPKVIWEERVDVVEGRCEGVAERIEIVLQIVCATVPTT